MSLLLDISTAWRLGKGEQKILVQNLLFRNGLRFVQNSKKFEHLTHAYSMSWKKHVTETGGWRPRQDLNPCYRRERTAHTRLKGLRRGGRPLHSWKYPVAGRKP